MLGMGAAAAASAGGYWRLREAPTVVHAPGKSEGHALRDRRRLPPASEVIETDVVILGSGIAALTAAWKLNREGWRNFLMIDGPQPYGNAAALDAHAVPCPTGAHYLPLPGPELIHVREILRDLGVLLHGMANEQPVYDERYLLHAPEERLLFNGRWQEGILPKEGVPQAELEEHARFFRLVEQGKAAKGMDGRPAFAFPMANSSMDASWRALDRLSMKAWLDERGFRSPTLHWYVDYCCRDDYGAAYGQVSAWAGMHYFCSRHGRAQNAADGAWLTWPEGLHFLAAGLDRAAGARRRPGMAWELSERGRGVEVLCAELADGRPKSFLIKARRAICAMPLHVAAGIMPGLQSYGFDAALHLPSHAPWMVANFLMNQFPEELPAAPLSWDNVVFGGRGLGYVVSTHQDIRVSPPAKFVFSAYHAFGGQPPGQVRRWMESAAAAELLDVAGADLRAAYGSRLAGCVERVDITLRGHAMACPGVGFLGNAGLRALRAADGPVLFAHADLSGFSVFEEASWWGYQAAVRLLAA
ncbi:hypothetical protein SAMN06265795_101557 [Noviherbaspirillum humi]|uniref:NAD(P)-binding Rossmann-like domain-containing protein n=2 Tax=Noviherbaspirillum humi TaxID=1688639 RepID=A0A239CPT7_9BURK|nr:hypothetical protein SAMN06265795_101557 [Noviherbaspirillum humi]